MVMFYGKYMYNLLYETNEGINESINQSRNIGWHYWLAWLINWTCAMKSHTTYTSRTASTLPIRDGVFWSVKNSLRLNGLKRKMWRLFNFKLAIFRLQAERVESCANARGTTWRKTTARPTCASRIHLQHLPTTSPVPEIYKEEKDKNNKQHLPCSASRNLPEDPSPTTILIFEKVRRTTCLVVAMLWKVTMGQPIPQNKKNSFVWNRLACSIWRKERLETTKRNETKRKRIQDRHIHGNENSPMKTTLIQYCKLNLEEGTIVIL